MNFQECATEKLYVCTLICATYRDTRTMLDAYTPKSKGGGMEGGVMIDLITNSH